MRRNPEQNRTLTLLLDGAGTDADLEYDVKVIADYTCSLGKLEGLDKQALQALNVYTDFITDEMIAPGAAKRPSGDNDECRHYYRQFCII